MNMQQSDDEKFENFLRQFRPRAPEPLRIEKHERPIKRAFLFAAWAAAAAAAVLIAVVLTMRQIPQQSQPSGDTKNLAGAEQLTNDQPLTIGAANALLAQSSSVKEAVDSLAFRSQPTQLSKGTHSALAVLSKENIKL